jgi:two-component system, chemotaxis family, CheB/CheR fusion protein
MSDLLQLRAEPSFSEVIHELATQRGLDLRGYKHGTLQRRMRKRMHQLKLRTFSEYLQHFQKDPSEASQLLETVLINVTDFFRDPQAWDVLRTAVLPSLLQRVGAGEVFRAWCAGCASGEEPYSLAILLADYFGPNLPERDIKIYATDIDEDALNAARRGEYPKERLRRIRPEWRQKYFAGSGATARIIYELRRLVVFGRNNLSIDAPISHCNLVVCRNLLIYFDSSAQQQIFKRLRYALETDGVLFLGKAEAKLTEWRDFRVINARWRIFQKISSPGESPARWAEKEAKMPNSSNSIAAQEELRRKRLEQHYILESLKSGLILLDNSNIVTMHNQAALRFWGVPDIHLVGRTLQTTEIAARCPELAAHLDSIRRKASYPVTFQCWIKPGDRPDRLISVHLRPMISDDGQHTGTLMNCDDITPQAALHTTVEQFDATGEELQSSNEELATANEELQSTNEELETTNEELQSTNEELETTNEELQSANEELETANEELQSLNEELENMNEELEHRTRELNEHTERYAETLRSMPFPVMLLDRAEKVQLWNSAAQALLGVGATSAAGIALSKFPLQDSLRKMLVRSCESVLLRQEPSVLQNQRLGAKSGETFDVHLTPVSRGESGVDGVLIVFSSFHAAPSAKAKKAAPAAARKPGAARKRTSGRSGRAKTKRR